MTEIVGAGDSLAVARARSYALGEPAPEGPKVLSGVAKQLAHGGELERALVTPPAKVEARERTEQPMERSRMARARAREGLDTLRTVRQRIGDAELGGRIHRLGRPARVDSETPNRKGTARPAARLLQCRSMNHHPIDIHAHFEEQALIVEGSALRPLAL